MQRLSWDDICRSESYRGRWVALQGCSYDESTGQAMEGSVVDVDSDLAELCHRVREADFRNCAILFARGEEAARRSSRPPPFM